MSDPATFGDIGFIGAGAFASALARSMGHHGYAVRAVASRTTASAERLAEALPACEPASAQQVADQCDTVFLAVPDDAIASVTATLSWRAGQAVVHCSGATPLAALDAPRDSGAATGAFHPLQTFTAGADPVAVTRGIAYAVEAPPPLRGALEQLAGDLGGWPIALASEDRALYHASAIAACGLVATLLKQASGLWDGVPGLEGQGLRALLPLTRSTLDNIERQGFPQALTGPAVRGDVGVVRSHLDALAERAPGLLHLYAALSLASLPIARDKGALSREREDQLREMFTASLVEAQPRPEGAPCA